MKILICVFTFPPEQNGVSYVAGHHAREFVKRGHQVSVATSRQPGEPEFETISGVDVYRFAASGSAYPRSRYQGETQKYREFLEKFDCDIAFFHCWQIWSTDLSIQAFPKIRAKKVLVSHGVSANNFGGGPRRWLNWFLWRPYVWTTMPVILSAMDHLVTLATDKRPACFYDYHLAQRSEYRQLSVIPNGADMEEIDAAPNSFREDMNIQTRTMLLCAANYDEPKNQLGVLEAFLQSRVRDTTLVFIGSEKNSYSSRLERLYGKAAKRDHTGPVLFCDRLTRGQLFSAYKAADIVISGSKWECQPLVLLDAMGAGKAFISSDVGCVSEMPGGVVVGNTEEMAAAMAQLVGNEAKRKELGSAGRQACETNYNWSAVGDRYEQLVSDLTSGCAAKMTVGECPA